jgi:ArsR family transcriptional regulator, lead/cadmium/zinc/bismuth-responsive transcriptional repressor
MSTDAATTHSNHSSHHALPSNEDALQLGVLLGLLSDPVRLRVLFVLVGVDELCVGDIAEALAISDDQSSYALKQLRVAGLITARRDGRVINYRLSEGFPQQMLVHCLHQLLAISTKGAKS